MIPANLPPPAIPSLPEHLPGEPPLVRHSFIGIAWLLLTRFLSLGLRCLLAAPTWLLYALLRLLLPRPPHIPSVQRLLRVLWLTLTERPPAPVLAWHQRAFIALHVLRRAALCPLRGLAWYLDDLLYGRALSTMAIVSPLFELSAARSGSTQIAHYLEDDPQIVAPASLQTEFPYLWLWRSLDFVLARINLRDKLRTAAEATFPADFLARHELDAFRTDTFEMQFCHAQLVGIMLWLGSRAMIAEMGSARVSPTSESMWRDDFLRYLDGIGKKRLLLATMSGATIRNATDALASDEITEDMATQKPVGQPVRSPVRLMIKGHFLNVAEDLAQRYPDARFLTVVRVPDKRIQSVINFHRVQPKPVGVEPCPWNWLVQRAIEDEIAYCDIELAWFTAALPPLSPGRRTVVRFDDYVRDLAVTMRHVYQTCLDQSEPSPHVPRTHAARERSGYAIDRSLEQLHIDRAWLEQRLAAYFRWSRGSRA